jgi:hypothetical protein
MPLRRPRRGSMGPVSCACALCFTVPARCTREGERRGAPQVGRRHNASGMRLAARELPLRESSSKIYARPPRHQHGGRGDAPEGRRHTRRVFPSHSWCVEGSPRATAVRVGQGRSASCRACDTGVSPRRVPRPSCSAKRPAIAPAHAGPTQGKAPQMGRMWSEGFPPYRQTTRQAFPRDRSDGRTGDTED